MLVSSNKSKTERLDPIVNNKLVNDTLGHFKNDWFNHFVRDSGQVIDVNIHLPETIIISLHFPLPPPRPSPLCRNICDNICEKGPLGAEQNF
jgi:hypothetical protein